MQVQSKSISRILVIDPRGELGRHISETLRGTPYMIEIADGINGALEHLNFSPGMRAVLMHLPDILNGVTTLRALHARAESVPIIIIDPDPSISRAVEVMKHGAIDYLNSAQLDRKTLVACLSKSLELAAVKMQQKRLDARVAYAGRLANVARFSAGITRELNRSTAVVLANLRFLQAHVGSTQQYLQATHRLIQDYVAPEDQRRLATQLTEQHDFLVQGSEAAGAVDDSIEATGSIQRIVHDLKVLAPQGDEEAMSEQDPRALVDAVIDLIYPLLTARARLERDFNKVPQVRIQRGRVAQVLLNILLNAIEAIPEDNPNEHRIRIKMRSTERDVHITVRDTGVGIPQENITKVFQPFFSTRRPGRGSGLGLSVANQVMLEHGGRVTLNSTIGEGTIVVITIPIRGRDNLSPLASGAVRKLIKAPMLMIESDPSMLDSYARLYGNLAKVETADNIDDAWNLLSAGRLYDLIIVDLSLPEDGAMELLRRTREEGLHNHLDRWIFSSRDLDESLIVEDRVEGLEVMRKPLSFEVILKRLSEI